MFKKILSYFGYLVLTAIPAAYLFYSSKLSSKEMNDLICKKINITIVDSNINRFISCQEIVELLKIEGITEKESKIRHINQNELEQRLDRETAIKHTQVYTTRSGELKIRVEQRRPVIRLQTVNGGFYIDETVYIFPLMKKFTSYVPIVTGSIPLNIPPGFKGMCKEEEEWGRKIKDFGIFLSDNPFWDSIIEQIDVNDKGELILTPRIGKIEILFGKPESIEQKFKKLEAFYKKVLPVAGWESYRGVDLRFSNHIVCKKR